MSERDQHPRDRALDAAMRHSKQFQDDIRAYTGFRNGAIFMHQYLANEESR